MYNVSGDTSYGMLGQAKELVKKMVENQKYDFFGSWKVLTLFIGGNDLCSCCRWWMDYKERYNPGNYVKGTFIIKVHLMEQLLLQVFFFVCSAFHILVCKWNLKVA